MEVQGDRLHRPHPHILGKVVVQRRQQPFRRDGAFRLHTDAELPGMNAGIRAGTGFDILRQAGNLLQRLLEHLLHSPGVFLDLPAVVGSAVVSQFDQIISLHGPPHHRLTAGSSRFNAPKSTNTAREKARTHQSPLPKWSCFILVRPSPPW